MLRIPELIVNEARRLAVETGLRLYLVGGLAAYAARHTQDAPVDWDIILIGKKREYVEWTMDVVRPGEDDCNVPFLSDAQLDTSLTRFGGLRILVTGGPVEQIDVWHHKTLEDYLLRSDKGAGFVVDPVTMQVWRKVEGPKDTVGVYVRSSNAGVWVNAFNHTFPPRADKADYRVEVTKRLDAAIAPGSYEVELREANGTVLRSFTYERKAAAAANAPLPPVPPVKKMGRVRWWYGKDVEFEYAVPAVKERMVLDALRALGRAGEVPQTGQITLVFTGGTEKDYGSAFVYDIPQRPEVEKLLVGDGRGNTSPLYLLKDVPLSSLKEEVTAVVRKNAPPGAAVVTVSRPGTFDSMSWAVPGEKKVWQARNATRGSDWLKFDLPAGATKDDVEREAGRVFKARGYVVFSGDKVEVCPV